MKKELKEISPEKKGHDYVCQECGEPAEYYVEKRSHKYALDEDGETMDEVDDWTDGNGYYYCGNC